MRDKRWAGHLGALAVVAVWGSTFISSKVLLGRGLTPAEIFFIRFLMAYVCMVVMCHRRLWADNWRDELVLMGLGLTGGSLYFMAENMALIYSTAANVSILVSCSPILTALVVGLFYRSERLHGRQIVGSVIAFIGMAMVVLNGQLILHLRPLGDALAISAALTWAFYSLFMRMLLGRYSTDFITRKIFFYGLVSILPYFIWVHPMQLDGSLLSQPVVALNLLFLGLIASTGCYLLWNWVLGRLGTVKATNYLYVQSLVTMLVAHIILTERITWMAILGAVTLIWGMTIVQRKKSK